MNSKILPKPKVWEDFEDLCCDLWKSIWGDPNAQLHGRRGQKQYGVDIFGKPPYASRYHAVQCKGKDDNKLSFLSEAEIQKECDNAKDFVPQIENFVVATTANRDTELQKYCRVLTEKSCYPFRVGVWSWEDISSEIFSRPDLMRKHFPQFYCPDSPVNEFVIDINSTQDKLAAFLSRPDFLHCSTKDLIQRLYLLIYEVVDNAFKHGKASYCKVSIDGNKIEIKDNGFPFDTMKLGEISDGRGGAETFRCVTDELKDYLIISYERVIENVTTLTLLSENPIPPLSDSIEFLIDDSICFGRGIAESMAYSHVRAIPSYKKNIIINVVVNLGLAISFSSEYFVRICKAIAPDQSITVYVPHNFMGLDTLTKELSTYPIKFIMRN